MKKKLRACDLLSLKAGSLCKTEDDGFVIFLKKEKLEYNERDFICHFCNLEDFSYWSTYPVSKKDHDEFGELF